MPVQELLDDEPRLIDTDQFEEMKETLEMYDGVEIQYCSHRAEDYEPRKVFAEVRHVKEDRIRVKTFDKQKFWELNENGGVFNSKSYHPFIGAILEVTKMYSFENVERERWH
jgi:hypothetical protein